MKSMKFMYALFTPLAVTTVVLILIVFYQVSARIRQERNQEKQQTKEWTEQACQNAQNYLSEKYGFQAEIISTEQDWNHGCGGKQLNTDILIRMQYQDKTFDVGINGFQPNTNGFDSYQTDEILQSVRNECEKAVPDTADIFLNHGEFSFDNLESEPLFSTYFDGSNAPELLQNSHLCIKYIQKDLSVMRNYPNFRRFQDIMFVSFRSEQDFRNAPGYGFSQEELSRNAVYIENAYQFLNKEEKYNQYDLGQCGNIYYYISVGNPDQIQISEIDPDTVFHLLSDLPLRTELASETWKIKAEANAEIYIFIPSEEISGYDDEHTVINCMTRRNDENKVQEIWYANRKFPYHVERFSVNANEKFYFFYLKSKQ